MASPTKKPFPIRRKNSIHEGFEHAPGGGAAFKVI